MAKNLRNSLKASIISSIAGGFTSGRIALIQKFLKTQGLVDQIITQSGDNIVVMVRKTSWKPDPMIPMHGFIQG